MGGIPVHFSAVQESFIKGFNDAAVSEDSNISIQVNITIIIMIFWNVFSKEKKFIFELKAPVIQTL